MPTIQSFGIGSGVDVDSIITALVNAEKAPTETKLNTQEESVNARISAFGTLKSKLSSLQSAVSSLKLTSNFDKYNATSSNENIFTASTDTLATSGSYDIKVSQIAKSHTLATTAFSDVNDTIGTGTLNIKFGTTDYTAGTDTYNSFTQNSALTEKNITIDATNNTLSSLKDYINAGDYGFTASIVNDGSGYRLMFSSDTGEASSLQINVTDDDANHTDASGLSRLAFNASATNLEQTQAAQDANLTINGLAVTSTDNTVEGAITGVTLNLAGADAANSYKLTVSRDTSAIKDQITSLVDAYNEFNSYVNEVTKVDLTGEENGALVGDFTVRNMLSQIRTTLFSPVEGLTGSVRAIADLGILSNSKTGQLEVDDSKLTDAINTSIEDVRALFAPTGKTSDALVKYVSNTADTQTGSYAVNITQLATRAQFDGANVLPNFGGGGSVTIDGDNDEFKVRVNGYETGTVTLEQKAYNTGESLATEIQNKINADSNLSAQNIKVSVTYDSANNKFVVNSQTYGSTSTIAFTAVDPSASSSTAATLGFSVGGGTNGVDVQGTINGKAAGGSGQFLTSSDGDSKGLKLSIIGGAIGDRGTVTFSRGVGDLLDTLMDGFVDKDGTIDQKTSGLDNTLEDISEAREALDYRIDKYELRLIKQFTAMDTLVGQLNNLSSYLTSVFNPPSSSK